MHSVELPRRRFLLGLMAAPAIVRAASLMPIRCYGGPAGGAMSDGVALTSMSHPEGEWLYVSPDIELRTLQTIEQILPGGQWDRCSIRIYQRT